MTKRSLVRGFLSLTLYFSSFSAHATDLEQDDSASVQSPAPQIARFMIWIDRIEKVLFSVPAADVPDQLVEKKSRADIFNIQGLGRLYASEDPFFEDMRERFKDLEDAIGEYQKWVDYEQEGIKKGVSEAVLAKLKRNRENGRAQLERALLASSFLPRRAAVEPYTKTLKAFLNSYAWKDRVTDQNEILQKLIDELEMVKTAEYDFSHLEEGNGVHEFRRKMRWFSMETRGLNGLITLKSVSEACPVASWAYLIHDSIAGTKYAVLPASDSEPSPVTLSPCLYLKVARMVEDVNQIKAKAEAEESLGEGDPSDMVAVSEQMKVQAMYDDILANGLFTLLQEELAAGIRAQP